MPILATRSLSRGNETASTVFASFTGPSTPIRDYTLDLVDTSTGSIFSWLWILTGSGGEVATSTDQNPTFGPDILQPLGPDDYDVELIVNGLTGQSATGSFAVTADGLWLDVPVYNGSDQVTVDILLATDELGAALASPDTFDLEITDEDDNVLASKSGLVWNDDPASWTTTQMLFLTGAAEQGGSIPFATESRSAYKITITTNGTYPTTHSRTIVVHPGQPSVAATFSRITEFDPDSINSSQVATANTQFAALTPGNLAEFVMDGVAGLTNGLRNALDATSNTYPIIVEPVNGGPTYIRYRTNTKRRCQSFLSKEGATALPGMAPVQGTHYRYGFDVRVPEQDWWDEFKAAPAGSVIIMSQFHVDTTNDTYTSIPSGSCGVWLESRNNISLDPFIRLFFAGDENDDSTSVWSGWTCKLLNSSGRWVRCHPVDGHTWSNSEPTLINWDFVPGKWYRCLIDFVFDNASTGSHHLWMNEIDVFGEDAGSKLIEETATTNCFPISGTYAGRTMREPQFGVSNVNAEVGGWTPSSGHINIDYTRFFWDEV